MKVKDMIYYFVEKVRPQKVMSSIHERKENRQTKKKRKKKRKEGRK